MASKEESLIETGSFNKRHLDVSAGIFKTSQFFDARDLVQVKYEMLRAVGSDGSSVADAAGKFGFSRKTYYQVGKAFGEGGLSALVPKKTGPKGPSKLRGEVSEFIDSYIERHERANAKEVAAQLDAEVGVRIHPRTIERYLEKKTDDSARRH
jgi:transposase